MDMDQLRAWEHATRWRQTRSFATQDRFYFSLSSTHRWIFMNAGGLVWWSLVASQLVGTSSRAPLFHQVTVTSRDSSEVFVHCSDGNRQPQDFHKEFKTSRWSSILHFFCCDFRTSFFFWLRIEFLPLLTYNDLSQIQRLFYCHYYS